MLGIKKTTTNSEVQVFQKEIEVAQGGFVMNKANLVNGETIPAGSVLNFDEATRTAKVLKTATVSATAAGSATAYQVNKGHLFKAGDKIGRVVGGVGTTIDSVDSSNANYDVLNVAATMGAAAIGDGLFESAATGATAAALAVAPKGLLRSSIDLIEGFEHEAGAVIRGSVYARRIPGVTAEIKAALPLINFSNSF